jgi:Flp pilus assembly protein CpaB
MSDQRLEKIEKRLRNLAILLSIVAIPVTVIAIFVLSFLVDSMSSHGPYRVECVVARNDLPAGHVITKDDIALRTHTYSKDFPEDIYHSDSAELLIGHRLLSPMKKGDAVTKAKIQTIGEWPPRFDGPAK